MSERVLQDVRFQLLAKGVPPSTHSVTDAVRSSGHVVGSSALVDAVARLRNDLIGFGPLQSLMATQGVTDVLVNGPSEVWIDRGNGLERAATSFPDEASVRRLVQRLVSGVGRRIDDTHPFVDAQLPGRVRLHAILPPLSSQICVSLRVARRSAFTLDELVRVNTIHRELAPHLEDLVSSRRSFLVTGGTGSGKTTVLASLIGLVDIRSRIVIVEDTMELRPEHPHVIGLESRAANVEGSGAIAMSTLVRQALRMRPDRIVVGEARGAEIVDLLAALNTGHEGGCATLHANSPADVPSRIEALCASAGVDRRSAHSQLASALDTVVHLARRADGSRFVSEVAEIEQRPDGLVGCRSVWQVEASGEISCGPLP